MDTSGSSNTTDGGPAELRKLARLIFGIISLIMALIALVLMQVNSNLKKLSDDTEGILRPEPVPFYRNKVYIALFSIVLFIVGGYYTAKCSNRFWQTKKLSACAADLLFS